MIASYTTTHIPAANAFFYRSLPSSPLGLLATAQSEMPVVPVVWPLLMGGEEASIGARLSVCFHLIYGAHMQFGLIGKFELPVMAVSHVAQSNCCSCLMWTYCVAVTAGVPAVNEVLGCGDVRLYDLTNTDDLLKASPLPIIFPSPDAALPHSLLFIGSLPYINIVLL